MPTVVIVASTLDPASRNIAGNLIRIHGFSRPEETLADLNLLILSRGISKIGLLMTEEQLVEFKPCPFMEKVSLLIFVSRHESQSGLPSLTVHAPGNLAEADHGGRPREVSVSAPGPMKDALRSLSLEKDRAGLSHVVSYEATHHGPSIMKSCLFVEIGSDEKKWIDPTAGVVAADAAMAAAESMNSYNPAIGVGGPHYNPKFTEVGLRTNLALGHIIPKHMTSTLTPGVLDQCLERTYGGVQTALVDWKGTPGPERRWVVDHLRRRGIAVKRV